MLLCVHVLVLCCVVQKCEQDVIMAIEDPEGMEMLSGLVESGARIHNPTEVTLSFRCMSLHLILQHYLPVCRVSDSLNHIVLGQQSLQSNN